MPNKIWYVSCHMQRGVAIDTLGAELVSCELMILALKCHNFRFFSEYCFVLLWVCSTNLPSGDQVDGLPLVASNARLSKSRWSGTKLMCGKTGLLT